MKKITICVILTFLLVPYNSIFSQEITVTIESLETSREKIIEEEKDALKIEVEEINKKLDKGTIDLTKADELKAETAEKRALNIENRIAIIDNKIALLERNDTETTIYLNKNKVRVEVFEDGDFVSVSLNKKKKYDRRTINMLVVAFGFNNLVTEGESFNDTDIKIGGSRFFEMGWAWKTRILKENNLWRIKYGFSFSFDGLKPTDNRYYVTDGDETLLQVHPQNLNKAKLRVDKLIFPVHIEFGPSRKIENADYFRYSTRKQFKVGIGGFTGFKLSSRQKLKYDENGSSKKEKIKASYNTNNVIYGLSGYIGWSCTSLYMKYELNPIFNNNPVDQHNVSLGLRFDL